MSELVTGDAVVLELRVARLATRGLAFALDVMVQFFLLIVLFLIIVPSGPFADAALVITTMLVVVVITLVGYPVLFETLSRGRTLGKMAVGLRVVREDGGPIRFRHALVRGLAGFFVDFWALGLGGAVAVFVSLGSKQGKRVGDFLAGTVVIRERVTAVATAHIAMPPALQPWASHLDLSRLPDDLALTVRQFLGRFHELAPDAQHTLGQSLANEVTRYVGPPPMAGVPPHAYLSAVLAERRQREHAKLNAPGYPFARPE